MTAPRPADLATLTLPPVTLDDLTEQVADEQAPWLDRAAPAWHSVANPDLRAWCERWADDGVLRLPGYIPDDIIDRYSAAWMLANSVESGLCGPEWNEVAYMRSEAVRDLFLFPPLMSTMSFLLGEAMGLHLNLLNWRSTTRDWHQDDYLNPSFINGHYAAVWIALDDVHPDSGPFQYVPGSHRWPVLRRHKVLAALGEDGSDPDWPWRSEQLLSPLYEAKFAAEGIVPVTHLAKRGDVLLWHARLLHRGSRPNTPGLERKAAIGHYSSVRHRVDMPVVAQHGHDALARYFVLGR